MTRLRIADDLVITLGGHLVTVASQRVEPGTLVYDLAFLDLRVGRDGDGLAVAVSNVGRYAPHQLLRFTVPASLVAAFEEFAAEVDAARAALN